MHVKNSQFQLSSNYDRSWLIGRNVLLQKCIVMLINDSVCKNEHKFLKLFGDTGCGRLVMAKKACQYVMERGYFVNGAFEINAKCEDTSIGFQKLMFQKMRLPSMNDIQDFTDILRKKKMVLIIYNIDKILSNDKSEFLNTL